MHEGTPSGTSPCDTDTTNKKKKLRYQTGPLFFEKVNVEVTNQFQSCKKYGPLHVSDEQPCLKFPVYGAKLHIGTNVECTSRAHNDQVGSDFMTKKTTALKWRFSISTTDPPAFTSRSLPRKILTMCPISIRKNSFRRVVQAIKTTMPYFSHALLYSTKQNVSQLFGSHCKRRYKVACQPSCQEPRHHDTNVKGHVSRSCSSSTVSRRTFSTSTTSIPLIVHHVLKHSTLFNLNCAHISRNQQKCRSNPVRHDRS